MTDIFKTILELSILGSLLILGLLFLRVLPLRFPKWGNTALWGLVGLRLLVPFHLESQFSLIPGKELVHSELTGNFTEVPPLDVTQSTPALSNALNILTVIWAAGVGVMMLHFLISYIKLTLKLRTAVKYRDNIYRSECTEMPMVAGFFRPKIYLPFSVDENVTKHIIAHEQIHICRGDHWWKLLAYFCLSLHWFNPLVWIAYTCFGRDIELACDEAVIRKLDQQGRAGYAEALMLYSIKVKHASAAPMTFSVANPKERIQAIAQYHRPGKGSLFLMAVCTVILVICFLTEPATAVTDAPVESVIEPTSASTPAEQDEEAIHIDPEKIKQEVEALREELEKKKQEAEAMLDLMKGIGALP